MDDSTAGRDRTLAVAIRAADRETLFELVRTSNYDFGCRPKAIAIDGGFVTPAVLSPADREELERSRFGVEVDVLFDIVEADRTAAATIGRGDRFEGGRRPPQGAGSRDRGQHREIGLIMNSDEIGTAIDGPGQRVGMPAFTLPNATAEGGTFHRRPGRRLDLSSTTCTSPRAFTRANAAGPTPDLLHLRPAASPKGPGSDSPTDPNTTT